MLSGHPPHWGTPEGSGSSCEEVEHAFTGNVLASAKTLGTLRWSFGCLLDLRAEELIPLSPSNLDFNQVQPTARPLTWRVLALIVRSARRLRP